jgi:hypothetical protein
VAFTINVVALFARLRMVAAEDYDTLFRTRELQAAGIAVTIRVTFRHVASTSRGYAARIRCLSLAKTCSIGLRSGL